MKTVLHCNEVEKDTIPHNGHKIDEAEGDADPDVVLLKSRDTQKGEGNCVVASQIVYGHGDLMNSFCVLKQIVYNNIFKKLYGNSSCSIFLGSALLFLMAKKEPPFSIKTMLISSRKMLKNQYSWLSSPRLSKIFFKLHEMLFPF